MKAEEMRVMGTINDYCVEHNISKQMIADKLHKDVSLVKKQMSGGGAATLMVAYDYASAAGGTVVFMTDEQYEKMLNVDKYIARITELEALETNTESEYEKLKAKLKELEDANEELKANNKGLIVAMEKRLNVLDERAKTIREQNEILYDLRKDFTALLKAAAKAGVDLSVLDREKSKI